MPRRRPASSNSDTASAALHRLRHRGTVDRLLNKLGHPMHLAALEQRSLDSSATGDDLVCWTRMQAEAGQTLDQIVARKELERQAGQGLFCWGVGNAPAASIGSLARSGTPVTVIFSKMKGKARLEDSRPRRVLLWRKFRDLNGDERELPANVIITSRGDTKTTEKKRHYALMCFSAAPLSIKHGIPFDPSAYRNASGAGGVIGYSQVTALLRRATVSETTGSYEANFTARLSGSYWVPLHDPAILHSDDLSLLADAGTSDAANWMQTSRLLRSLYPSRSRCQQPLLI